MHKCFSLYVFWKLHLIINLKIQLEQFHIHFGSLPTAPLFKQDRGGVDLRPTAVWSKGLIEREQ